MWVLLLTLMVTFMGSGAQEPAQTLVPPTLVPNTGGGAEDLILTTSTVQRIVDAGRVRIGMLYNAPPFGELNIRGEQLGFDADLARALAEAWGVELELIQVTRQTAEEMLDRGQVDMLIASFVHIRDLDDEYEFSQTYHLGSVSIMVRADDGAEAPGDMANRKLGVVMGTAEEEALTDWLARVNLPVSVERYLTLDRLYGALRSSEIDGMIGSQHRLVRAGIREPEATRLLEEPLELEPYAVAMPRQDVNLRNLVNKTLQYLQREGRLEALREVHFPEASFDSIPVWRNLGDEAPKPGEFLATVSFPSEYVIPRLQADRTLRVAGIQGITVDTADVSESDRRIEVFHRSLIDAIAQRWGVSVQYIPSTPEEALDLVSSGQADLALGADPDWAWVDRVDFSGPYLVRGMRLMVKQNSNIFGFAELAGSRWVGITRADENARELALELADSVNAFIEIFETREQDFALVILEDRNADVAFADSVRLLPYLEQYPNDFQLTTRWYTRRYISMAVPRNDIDFRLLVDYTLQELARDGTLYDLLRPVTPSDERLRFDVWPGTGEYFGFAVEQ
jgi:ABC-type amino acid transport substrate-binding protein